MERITLMCVLLTAVVSSSPHQYHFVNQNMSWTEAQRYCREKYTDLVTINDIQEQNEIKQLIQRENSTADRVWIGLKNTKVGVWSDPAFKSQYRKWGPSQPGGDGDCVYMDHEGQWHDVNCSTKWHFICYNDSSKGFFLERELMNWTDAQKYCRENHTDLASVRNESENEQIKNIIKQIRPPKEAWIGLHRLWVWSDNSNATFTHWKPDNDNSRQNCTLMDIRAQEGLWTDEDCTHQHPFVCYDGDIRRF